MRLLNEVRNRETLSQAIEYACYDRIRTDHYMDFFELEYIVRHKSLVLDELEEELKTTSSFRQRPAYAFFPPKTELCFRRMVYLNFKDLVVRYSLAIVFAQVLDSQLLPTCFANRRATGKQAERSLTADFASDSWPSFCSWQREQAQSNTTLLRTDITSFYDSISHDYLVETFSAALSVPVDSQLMQLFRCILIVPVLAYSNETKQVQPAVKMRQGLPIGNNTEGFFANVYLKEVDSSMSQLKEVQYGRYNDDMRIFGNDRNEVLKALRILQEHLLTKGLNLNTSKTELAENEEQINKLRSHDSDVFQYFPENDELWYDEVELYDTESQITQRIDVPFEQFDRTFEPGETLTENTDAKDFCKYLSMQSQDNSEAKLSARLPQHIQTLKTVLRSWSGSSRHAAWLLVQSAIYRNVRRQTQLEARKAIFDVLADPNVNSYAKYRILHHLTKLRRRRDSHEFRFLDLLSSEYVARLSGILPDFLSVCDFELVIAALYTFRVLGKSEEDLRELVYMCIPAYEAEPYKNVLYYIGDTSAPIVSVSFASENEPDESIEIY